MYRAFIRSKLRRPGLTRHMVARVRLAQRLDQGLRDSLILISAPAGYGKTTLVSEWLARCPLPSAWISLDDDDNRVDAFMAYATAAVDSVYPDACRSTRALLQLAGSPRATVIADQFASDLGAVRGELVLVLDDCHHVHDLDVFGILAKLLQHPPASLHLVIVTRHDPPLPLAALRAQGRLTEVRSADLRFTTDETGRLFRQATGRRLDAATLGLLADELEGWAAGLQLLIRATDLEAVQPGELLRSLRRSARPAADYLAAEILSALSDEVRRYLIETAVLDRFCAPLIDALCAEPVRGAVRGAGTPPASGTLDGAAFIADLVARDLFIVSLDDRATWYRFHSVLQAILRQNLGATYRPSERDELHRRAFRWFREHGLVEQAIHHAAALGDWEGAADVVQAARIELVNREDWSSLRRWLAMLPSSVVNGTPELLIAQALEKQNTQHLDMVADLVSRAEARIAAGELPPASHRARAMAAEIAVLRSNSAYWRADVATCVAAAQRATELAPDELWFLRGAATLFLATGLQMDGHAAEALDILTQALERSPEAPTTYWTRLLLGMALVHWSTAELDRTLSVCDRLAALSQRDGLPASLAWANFLSGAARYLRGDPAAAARDFSVIVENSVSANPNVALQAHVGLAAGHLAAGRQAEAAEAARRTTAWALEVGMPGAINVTESFQARLALATGRAGAAIAWAANRLPPRSSAPLFLMEEPLLTWVHVQLARPGGAGLDEAADALAVERRFAEETHNTLRRIHVLALEALVLEASSRRVQALDALQGALALAEPGGIVQPFLDLLPGMAPLLQALAARSDGNAHVWRVQARRAGSRTPAPTGSASHGAGDGTLLDPLTPREMEILALLAQRLTNGEIAARLVVSPVTVKTHAHSIYSKLRARNRREAVARAQALGLLADS